MEVILGMAVGAVLMAFVHSLLHPCKHENTMVKKVCKDCNTEIM